MRKYVAVTWTTGQGEPNPASVSVVSEDEVEFTANGSDMTVKFPVHDICGQDEIDVDDGDSEVITISESPPKGTHECQIVNRKEPGDGTPPVSMIVG